MYRRPGQWLAVISFCGFVAMLTGCWRGRESPQLALQGHSEVILAAAFTPDGQTLLTTSADGTVITWEVSTGRQLANWQGSINGLTTAAFSPDGRILAMASKGGVVKLYDLTTNQEQSKLHSENDEEIRSLVFSPDGKTLAAGCGLGRVVLWDPKTAERRISFRANFFVVSIPDEPKSRILPGVAILAASFSPNGQTLATGSVYVSQDAPETGQVRLWKIDSLKDLNAMRAEAGWDSNHVASDHKSLKEPPGFSTDFGWLRALAFSPTGAILVAGGGKPDQPGGIKLCNLPSGEERASLVGHTKPVTCLAFCPDGKTLASGSADQTIKLWDLASHQERLTLRGHSGSITVVAFSPDGKTLASGSADKTVILWKLKNPE